MTAPTDPRRAWLDWYRDMGADEWIGEQAINRLAPAPEAPLPAPAAPPAGRADDPPGPRQPRLITPTPAVDAAEDARTVAAACRSIDELRDALERFEGCSLRDTAMRLCFADGNPSSDLMLIGESPGAEEDRQGKPFVGPSGQLLDRMLATIGRDRTNSYITNVIYWRPPGNRAPTQTELLVCQPFLERQIELIRPRLIVFVGGIAARTLLGLREGVTRLRGRRFTYRSDQLEIPALVTFHPAYLLRQPANKRQSWRDLLTIRRLLQE
ncbi:MAG TPA: uracil-DNA glycosylase [Geminicoccaceae bacterium]